MVSVNIHSKCNLCNPNFTFITESFFLSKGLVLKGLSLKLLAQFPILQTRGDETFMWTFY